MLNGPSLSRRFQLVKEPVFTSGMIGDPLRQFRMVTKDSQRVSDVPIHRYNNVPRMTKYAMLK